jgi:NitT/TauT family transport system permease protein
LNLKVQLARIAVLTAVLIFWQLAPTYNIINRYIVAPLSQVVVSFPQLNNPNNFDIPLHGLLPNVFLTLGEIAIGFVLSVGIGLTIGFIIGYYNTVGGAFEPFVYVFHSIPAIVLYPLLYYALGFGWESKAAFAILLGTFPLIINTIAGFRQIKVSYVKYAKSLDANDRQIFFRVLIPAAFPNIMSGLRLCLGLVVIAVITAEILFSSAGLGRMIVNFSFSVETAQMYATFVIVIVIAYFLYLLTTLVERKVLPHERI